MSRKVGCGGGGGVGWRWEMRVGESLLNFVVLCIESRLGNSCRGRAE